SHGGFPVVITVAGGHGTLLVLVLVDGNSGVLLGLAPGAAEIVGVGLAERLSGDRVELGVLVGQSRCGRCERVVGRPVDPQRDRVAVLGLADHGGVAGPGLAGAPLVGGGPGGDDVVGQGSRCLLGV